MIMATINDKLTYIEGTKDAIKQAIIAKGVSVSDVDTFRSYANKIEAIQAGGSIAGAPSGMKFANSTFTTVPVEIFPYLEAQTDLSGIFENCKSLTTVPLFDTSKAINMYKMFYYCKSLTSVPQFDASNVADMSSMFSNCTSLQTVPLFSTSNVNDMSYMFKGCDSLTSVPQFNTSNVNDMRFMFGDCTSLKTVPLFNTSNATNMYYMFSYCGNLTTVPQFDTSNVADMSYMFTRCTSLKTVPLFNTSNVNTMSFMFSSCDSLTNLGGFTGLKLNLDLSSSSKLTVESVMNVITNAANMTSSPKTLTLSKTVFNKLSQEQKATANAKGWNIASK